MKSDNPTVTERRKVREAPGPHFQKVAVAWSEILNWNVSPVEVVRCMVMLKLVRESGMHDPDNLIDAEGYLSLIPEVTEYMQAIAPKAPPKAGAPGCGYDPETGTFG